jgi:hypothetical protein
MTIDLKRPYLTLLVVALLASCYSFFKTGIVAPIYPKLLNQRLSEMDLMNSSVSATSVSLEKQDSSDRMLSPLYQYQLKDGSRLLAVMVRVRKRDDFKIETYGLLTKGIEQIHMKSPTFNGSVPYSMIGLLGGVDALQTCVLPGTQKLDQVNVQLFPLVSQADRLAGNSRSLLSKFLGTDDRADYSCLVLTYQPKSLKIAMDHWVRIIQTSQLALADQDKL